MADNISSNNDIDNEQDIVVAEPPVDGWWTGAAKEGKEFLLFIRYNNPYNILYSSTKKIINQECHLKTPKVLQTTEKYVLPPLHESGLKLLLKYNWLWKFQNAATICLTCMLCSTTLLFLYRKN